MNKTRHNSGISHNQILQGLLLLGIAAALIMGSVPQANSSDSTDGEPVVLPGGWYGMPGRPFDGQFCGGRNFFLAGSTCFGPCKRGYNPVSKAPIGYVCIKCPLGTKRFRLEQNGDLLCFQ